MVQTRHCSYCNTQAGQIHVHCICVQYVDVVQADVDNAIGKGSSHLQTALLGQARIELHMHTGDVHVCMALHAHDH